MISTANMFRHETEPFFESPSREALAQILTSKPNETSYLEFKQGWPTDAVLCKHILAIANSSLGAIVIGVVEDKTVLISKGLPSPPRDDAETTKIYQKYLPNTLAAQVRTMTCSYGTDNTHPSIADKTFQVVLVPSDPNQLPYLAKRATDGLSKTAIYVRRGASSETATHDELHRLLARRITASQSTESEQGIKPHLNHLRQLYNEIPQNLRSGAIASFIDSLNNSVYGQPVPNPDYPIEDYASFIRRMIDRKKDLVEQLLGTQSDNQDPDL